MKNNYLLIGLCLGFVFLCGNVKGQEWELKQKIEFGDSTYLAIRNFDVYGDFLFVGDTSFDIDTIVDVGRVLVYKKNENNWEFHSFIYASDTIKQQYFGVSIAMDGDYALISAPCDYYDYNNMGATYIFKRDGENWIEQAKVEPSDTLQRNPQFGYQVDISGDYAVVGANVEYVGDGGNVAGAAYFFKRNGENWNLITKVLDPTGPNNQSFFGSTVKIKDNMALVGTLSGNSNGPLTHYYKLIDDNWIHSQTLVLYEAAFDFSFFDNYLAIGGEDNIHIFKLENNQWNLHQTIVPPTFPPQYATKISVILKENSLFVGGVVKFTIGDSYNRYSYVYEYTKLGNYWGFPKKFNRGIDYANDRFGRQKLLFHQGGLIIKSGNTHPNTEYLPNYPETLHFFQKTTGNLIKGKVFKDDNLNCQKDTLEQGRQDFIIKAEPGPYYASIDENGNYELEVGEGTYTLTQVPPSHLALSATQLCPTQPYTITFEGLGKDTTGFDFANSITECSLLKVDVSSNRRRRCFTNQTTVSYCNEGLVAAENVEIKVTFPQYVLPLSSTQPWTSRQDSVYTFTIGTLAPGQCGNFTITDSVACVSGITGAAQCTQASIFPKNNCVQPNEDWNGAALAITGECLILFDPVALVTIKNTGTANMTTVSQFRIFSSDTLVYQDQLQLVAGDSLVFEIPTQGQTVRIEVDQVPNYPGGTMISYQTSGDCGSPNTPNTALASLAMQFPADDEAAEVESECLPIIDSYDPNDKQVHPIGFTENHYVRPGTELEYTIRFQNTGTAEAVNIVVIDTLSADLDMTQFQMMSASHPYKLQVSGKGKPILTWLFNNINLPDSTSNEPASHGFIKFKIKPLATIPEGTIIENFGDIYFDFNDPIRTNTTVSNITNYQFPTALIDFCTMVRKAEAGTNQTLCQTTATLSGNTPTFGQGTWSVVSGAGTFTDANLPNSQVNNLAVGENIFKWRISSSECTATESTVKITRLPFPTQANAGTDKTICEANSTLQGNTPSIGQGKWTLVSGSATILNVNVSNSAIQNIAYGENIFRWSIGNGTCDSTHSQVKIIRLREPTIANAGTDKSICESNYTLQGNTPQYGQGTWSKVSGSGNILNANSPNASIENLTVGESIFEWKITNGICTSSQSQVKITRLSAQVNSVSIQSTATAICAGETITFTATATNAGTNPVYQWKINGQNTGTNSATFASNQIQNNDLVTVEMQANVACPSPATAISNEIKMTIYPKPARPEIQQTRLNLLKSSVSGLNYRWYKDGVLLANANKDTLQIDELGIYEVEVLGENCVSEKSEALQLNEEALQQFASLRKANVFPNPNAGKFTLKIPNNAGSSVKIELFDSQGKSLFRKEYPSSKLIDFEEEIQTQNLQSGTYLLQIETLQGKETKRVVIR